MSSLPFTGTGPQAANYWIDHAAREIYEQYGERISVIEKRKTLHKFGRTNNADAGVLTTIAQFQDAVVNETYATGNTVDRIVSTNTNDTETMVVEGHTINGTTGDKTFVAQEVTLTGQTPVALGTALGRVTRAYVKAGTFASPASDLVGDVTVFDNAANSGLTGGKPDTDASVKIMVLGTAGKNQSEKASTSLSSTDYYLVREVVFSITRSTGANVNVDCDVEFRELGGVWRQVGVEADLRSGASNIIHDEMEPYLIFPPNCDIRLVATSDTADTTVAGYMRGILATTNVT